MKFNSYNELGYTPIKLEDLFLLNATLDQKNTNQYFIVSKTDTIPVGINFDEQIMGARKVGLREIAASAYMFGFSKND